MPFWVKNGGGYAKPTGYWVKHNGAWTWIKEAWVKDAGVWKKYWPNIVQPSLVEYLVVAGGGGSDVGGGGAGGMLAGSINIAAGTTYPVTVGAGGSRNGTSGSNSSFAGIEAIGGGYGAGVINGVASAAAGGGSGGGGYILRFGTMVKTYLPGQETAGQGRAGGPALDAEGSNGGGGGGAGAAGSSTSGGAGLPSSITGVEKYYAGGGSAIRQATPGTAGIGGGGAANTDGAANTGGGAGGITHTGGSEHPGFAGGSGVVVIRYPDTMTAATTVVGGMHTQTGGYHIYEFTGSGSITF
jgi:hypothetical protein